LEYETDKYVLSSLLDDINNINISSDYEPIIKYLSDGRWLVRHSAIMALHNCRDHEVEVRILDVLENAKDEYDISYCIDTLSQIGTKKSIPYLMKFLNHSKGEIRGITIGALEALGGNSFESVFINGLKDRYSFAKFVSMRALSRHGTENALKAVCERVKKIVMGRRSMEILPKSDLVFGLKFLNKYRESDKKVQELFYLIKFKKWDNLFESEKRQLQLEIDYFKH
jgi:HEAT repeat protein